MRGIKEGMSFFSVTRISTAHSDACYKHLLAKQHKETDQSDFDNASTTRFTVKSDFDILMDVDSDISRQPTEYMGADLPFDSLHRIDSLSPSLGPEIPAAKLEFYLTDHEGEKIIDSSGEHKVLATLEGHTLRIFLEKFQEKLRTASLDPEKIDLFVRRLPKPPAYLPPDTSYIEAMEQIINQTAHYFYNPNRRKNS